VAAEQARTALAKAELRLEQLALLEEALRQTRAERDAQREALAEAERSAAVLGSKQAEHEERMQDIKSSLTNSRDACAKLETKNGEMAAALEQERQARAAVERELAVLAAVRVARPRPGSKSKRGRVQQGALWPGDGETPNGAVGPVAPSHPGD